MSKWDGLAQMAEELETSRLLLHRPTQADAEVLSSLWLDERIQQFMGGVLTSQEAEARVAAILQSWQDYKAGLWAVDEKGKGQPIGLCGLSIFEAEIEIIYKFFPLYWGHGYATEAASATLAYGFQILQIDRIIGITQAANHESQHVLEKIGMHYIRNLARWDALECVYELTRMEWLGQRAP